MVRVLIVILLTLLTWQAHSAEITPQNPVPAYSLVRVHSEGTLNVLSAKVDQQSGMIIFNSVDMARTPDGLVFTGPPGSYLVHGEEDGAYIQQVVNIAVGPAPGPTPPGPGPTPPGPTPTPGDVPFPSNGLAVMIVGEQSEIASLPVSQRAIFSSAAVLNYLRSVTMKAEDGNPAFRIWDDDYTDVSRAPQVMQRAYAAAKQLSNGQLPWIVISDGQRGYSGPLPTSVEATLQLLRQFGG